MNFYIFDRIMFVSGFMNFFYFWKKNVLNDLDLERLLNFIFCEV